MRFFEPGELRVPICRDLLAAVLLAAAWRRNFSVSLRSTYRCRCRSTTAPDCRSADRPSAAGWPPSSGRSRSCSRGCCGRRPARRSRRSRPVAIVPGARAGNRDRPALELARIVAALRVRGRRHLHGVVGNFRRQAARHGAAEVPLVLGVRLVGLPGELIGAAVADLAVQPLHVEVVLDEPGGQVIEQRPVARRVGQAHVVRRLRRCRR